VARVTGASEGLFVINNGTGALATTTTGDTDDELMLAGTADSALDRLEQTFW